MALCKSYKAEILQGVHTLSDVYKIALYSSSATLDENTTVYSATNEIVAAGYVAGGATLTNATVGFSGSAAVLDFDDVTYTNCSIVARKGLVYNSSKGNKAVSVVDFGTDTGVVGTGTVVIQIPSGIVKLS